MAGTRAVASSAGDDLMVDMAGGATIAVLSVGGFLGMGERYIAVPVSDLRWNNERGRWMLPGATVDSAQGAAGGLAPDVRMPARWSIGCAARVTDAAREAWLWGWSLPEKANAG